MTAAKLQSTAPCTTTCNLTLADTHSHWDPDTCTMSQTQTQRPPEVVSISEGPELGRTGLPPVPAKRLNTDYPVHHPRALYLYFTTNSTPPSSSTPTPTSLESSATPAAATTSPAPPWPPPDPP